MKAPATEYLEITEAEYLGDYRISLHFNDGKKCVMDFGPFLRKAKNPEITAHRSLKKFKNFHLHYGNLMWGDYEMIFPITDLHAGKI
ncbi:MAG: DUF2442 domain-containing protein [Limisphaerales bacterium]